MKTGMYYWLLSSTTSTFVWVFAGWIQDWLFVTSSRCGPVKLRWAEVHLCLARMSEFCCYVLSG